MRRLLFVLCLLVPVAARASGDKLNVSIGGGVDSGDSTGWAVRLGETMEVTDTDEGLIYGTTCGYDYWRASTSSGFNIPIGGYVGARTHDITTTFGAGVGLLAAEKMRGDAGFGVVPYVRAALGFELAGRRTITVDGRMSRHALVDVADFTRWSVLVMYGTTFAH